MKKLALPLLTSLLLAACATTPQTKPEPPQPALLAATPVAQAASFADNPIVYFVVTDRFANGNPANDGSYGRRKDGEQEIGTFHGGDLAGLTAKLKEGYFTQLGVNAIWITAPYEQIRGWVVGGKNEFKHYSYHGYYALDFTVLDQNMGTPDELREFVDTAHAQGVRVLFDVVMNHPGYADINTLSEFVPGLLWKGWQQYTLKDYHSWIDYNNFAFGDWWGGKWVRAGLPGYGEGGRDDLTMQLAYLPDFRTDSKEFVGLPKFLKNKPGTRAVELPNTTVRGYLVKWLSDWVRDYGIDGFRCDTAKHVELDAWKDLKTAATAALADWKARNPGKKIDDAPFWMTGEVWGQDVSRNAYFDNGFDSLINFEFQDRVGATSLEAIYSDYASKLGPRRFDVLSYLSSHDTRLFDRSKLQNAGTALMLAPGGVQIYYGDESGRKEGPATVGDPQQATRSDMNWQAMDAELLAHWRKLGDFRRRHPAIARGEHRKLADTPYVFSRSHAGFADRIVAAPQASGEVSLPVAGAFREGETVRDAYSGVTAKVSHGQVKLVATGTVLLETAGQR